MASIETYLSVFPDVVLVTKFINSLKLQYGGVQGLETLQDPSLRRMFQSVCYLHEIDYVYENDNKIPNMKKFMYEGIATIRKFILTTFDDEFNDDEDIQRLDSKLERTFELPNSSWVYCLHCESRCRMSNPLMGDVCEICGSWWLLRSLKVPHALPGVNATVVQTPKSSVLVEIDTERIENHDGILSIMNEKVMIYEKLCLEIHPFHLLSGVPEERGCPICYENFDRNPIALGKECRNQPDSKKELGLNNPHMIHFKCHENWFKEQVIGMGLQQPTCPACYHHNVDFTEFMNQTDYRSLKHLFKIAGNRRQVKDNRG